MDVDLIMMTRTIKNTLVIGCNIESFCLIISTDLPYS